MSKQPKIEDIFNECVERMLGGASAEECLRHYPAQAAELRPLLETLTVARQACLVAPRPDFRARARYQFRSAVAEACQPKPRLGWQWSWRLATVAPLAVAALLLSGGGVMAASMSSMPDQPLYAVKLGLEQAQLRFTPSTSGKVKLYAMMADRRAAEVAAMAEEGKSALAASATERLEESLSMVTAMLLGGSNSYNLTATGPTGNNDKSVQGQDGTYGTGESAAPTRATAPPMLASTATTAAGAGALPPAPAATTPTTTAPPITMPPASINLPPPTITMPPGTTTVAPVIQLPNIDPALLKFLQRYATDPAALQALLARVPESSRAALLEAITLMQNYQQLLAQLAAANAASAH